jgi:hypothetical protein
MVFVHDDPNSVYLAKTHREAKLQRFLCPAHARADAMPGPETEGHGVTRFDVEISDVKNSRLFRPREKCLPCLSVRIDTDRLERRRNVKHHHAIRVMRKDPLYVPIADGFRPFLYQRTYRLPVIHCFYHPQKGRLSQTTQALVVAKPK